MRSDAGLFVTLLSYPLTGPPKEFIIFSVVETGVSRNAGNDVGKSN